MNKPSILAILLLGSICFAGCSQEPEKDDPPVVDPKIAIEKKALANASSEGETADAPKRVAADKAHLQKAKRVSERALFLGDLAKDSFSAGEVADAKMFAEELREIVRKKKDEWDFRAAKGKAIQDVNIVLGRLALKEGRVAEAKTYLLAAGKGFDSSLENLDCPRNMSLARDLLLKGEKQVVLQYLEECKNSWIRGFDQIREWSAEITDGKIPDFGANLIE
jgi:thiamine pyrophosphokinase